MNPQEKVENQSINQIQGNEEGGKWKRNKPKMKGNKEEWKPMMIHKQVIKNMSERNNALKCDIGNKTNN